MAMVMAAFELVTVAPNWSTTWTLTGPALGESKLDVIIVLMVVPAGCPSVVNTSEHGLELLQPPEDARAAVGAASIAAPSMLAAPAAKSTRALGKTALRMTATPVRVSPLSVLTHAANMPLPV